MTTNFPQPLPDELLYSVIARHGWLQRSRSLKTLAESVFGTQHALAIVDLPGRIDSLYEAISNSTGLDVPTLLRKHTLLPLYAPFMPAKRLALIERDLAGNGGGAVHCRAGIAASRSAPPLRLRFCPSCAAEERAERGEAYWHRLHQIAGVYICPAHKVFLEESSALLRFRRTRHAFVPAEDVIPTMDGAPIDQRNPEHQILLRISQGADWLLQNYCAGNELISLQKRYHQHAMRLGFLTGAGRIRWQELLQEFRLRFPDHLLDKLNCSRPEGISDHWLARILRCPRVAQAPIRHLVLVDFFRLTPQAFLNTKSSTGIFGAGPWPCNNPVCPHRGGNCITQIQWEHSHQHRRPAGVFTCPTCGQTTCRVITNKGEIGWIRDYGPVWQRELSHLWVDPHFSLRGIARRLEVDPMTVQRHAAKAGLPFPRKGKRVAGRNGPPRVAAPKVPGSGLTSRRAEWLQLTVEWPSDGVTALRDQTPGCYSYLYRHDPDWLKEHSPVRPRSEKPPSRVDWALRDRRLAEEIPQARARLLETPGRPKLISAAALGRELGAVSWLQKHLSKMPHTRAALAAAVESRVDFVLRRVEWATRRLKTCRAGVKEWSLLRLAGVRPELHAHPEVRAIIHANVKSRNLLPDQKTGPI